jgi:hypothetical protein
VSPVMRCGKLVLRNMLEVQRVVALSYARPLDEKPGSSPASHQMASTSVFATHLSNTLKTANSADRAHVVFPFELERLSYTRLQRFGCR